MTDKPSKHREFRAAEDIMSEDRDILRALTAADREEQMPIARKVTERRREALKKLAE